MLDFETCGTCSASMQQFHPTDGVKAEAVVHCYSEWYFLQEGGGRMGAAVILTTPKPTWRVSPPWEEHVCAEGISHSISNHLAKHKNKTQVLRILWFFFFNCSFYYFFPILFINNSHIIQYMVSRVMRCIKSNHLYLNKMENN